MATTTEQKVRDLLAQFFAEHVSEVADTSEAAMPAVTEYVLVVRVDDMLTEQKTGGFYEVFGSSDETHRNVGLLEMARSILLTVTYATYGEDD